MKNFSTSAFCFCFLSVVFFSTGCKKQLDINYNPSVPTLQEGAPKLVFPPAVLATTGMVGGELEITGGMFAEYFTQASLSQQYTTIDSYDLTNTNPSINRPWNVLYPNGLKNYQYVIDQAASESDWNYYLMGTVMKAYTTEVLVDLYDQIPYSQALQGTNYLNPKFDDGLSVYTSLINSIDTALSKNFSASTNTAPGSSDLVFGGDMNSWIEFANTLKLKMYLRMINAKPDIAKEGVQSLYNNHTSFLSKDAAVTNFTNAPGLDNPFYEQNIRALNTSTNIKVSTTFVSWLKANNDPRIINFSGSVSPISEDQGDYTNISESGAAVFVQSPTDPVEFISLPESYFLQAEADLRYFGGLNAQSLYNQGVEAAFAQLGLNGSSFVTAGGAYAYPTAGTMADKLQAIIVQKWASCAYGCHGIEAWFEKNRTGYPLTSPVYSSNPTYIPGQIVISKNSVLPAGQLPKRFVFPYDETSRNTKTPPLVPITTPVWWGK